MVEGNIDLFLYYTFHINPAIEWIIRIFHLTYILLPLSWLLFQSWILFLTWLLHLFFIKCSKSFFTADITNNLYSWYNMLYFIDHKGFLRTIWCNLLKEYTCILIFSYDHQLWIQDLYRYALLSTRTWFNIHGLLIFLWYLLMYLSTFFIQLINVHIF